MSGDGSQSIALALKYVFALAAIASIQSMNYDLSWRTVWNGTCDCTLFPVLYGILALFTHFAGIMAFSIRIGVLPFPHSSTLSESLCESRTYLRSILLRQHTSRLESKRE